MRMLKPHQRALPLIGSMVAVTMVTKPVMPVIHAAEQGTQKEKEKVNALAALPTKAELTDLNVDRSGGENNIASLSGFRKADGALLNIVVVICPTSTAAYDRVMGCVGGSQVGMDTGCPSNRKIAEDVFQTPVRESEGRKSSFTLVAHDGRCFVMVSLGLPVDQDKKGNAVPRPITKADLMFVENHVVKMLHKLTLLGYTSKAAK